MTKFISSINLLYFNSVLIFYVSLVVYLLCVIVIFLVYFPSLVLYIAISSHHCDIVPFLSLV